MDGKAYNGRIGCLARLFIMSIAVMLGAWLLHGVTVDSFWAVLLTAVVISLLNNIVRPILIVITLPATTITMGLFLFVINGIIILMASAIVDGFEVKSLWWAILLSLIITATNYLLELPNRLFNRKTMVEDSDDTFTPYEDITDQE